VKLWPSPTDESGRYTTVAPAAVVLHASGRTKLSVSPARKVRPRFSPHVTPSQAFPSDKHISAFGMVHAQTVSPTGGIRSADPRRRSL
jgi:hypothetical protein